MNNHNNFGFSSPIKINQIATFKEKFDQMSRIGIFQERESLTAFLTAVIKCCDVLIDCKSKNEPTPFLKIVKKEFHYNRAKKKQLEKLKSIERNLELEKKKMLDMEAKTEQLMLEELKVVVDIPEIDVIFGSTEMTTKEEQKVIDNKRRDIRERELALYSEGKKIELAKVKIEEDRKDLEKLEMELRKTTKSAVELDVKATELENKIVNFNTYVIKENKRIDAFKEIMSHIDVDFEMVPAEHRDLTKFDLFSYVNQRNLWSDLTIFKKERVKTKYNKNIVPEKKTVDPIKTEIRAEIKAEVETKVVIDEFIVEDLKNKIHTAEERIQITRRLLGRRESNMIDLMESVFEQLCSYRNLDDFELYMKRFELDQTYRKFMSIIYNINN